MFNRVDNAWKLETADTEVLRKGPTFSETVPGLRELRPGEVGQTDAVLRRFKFAELRRTDVREAIDRLLRSRT